MMKLFTTGCSAVMAAAVLWTGASSADAGPLVRYEGHFDAVISTAPPPGMAGGGVTETQYAGTWAIEYAPGGYLTAGPGVRTIDVPVAAFDLTPDSLFGVTYGPENVDAHVDYRRGELFRFIMGGVGPGRGSAVGWSSLWNDFQVEYWANRTDTTGRLRDFDYGRADNGPRYVLNPSGSMARVRPDPYVWGEFDVPISGIPGMDRFAGRWAIDAPYITEPDLDPDEFFNTFTVPLRYLEITSDVPDGFTFNRRDAMALLDFRDGKLIDIVVGMGGDGNGPGVWSSVVRDVSLQYTFGFNPNILLTEEPDDFSIDLAISDGLGNWMNEDRIGRGDAWIVNTVPEPSTALVLMLLAGHALTRRGGRIVRDPAGGRGC